MPPLHLLPLFCRLGLGSVVLLLLATFSRLAAAGSVHVNVTDAKGAPVADAVVSLVPLDTPPRPSAPAAAVQISQQGQEFEPYVTPVVVGTRVTFSNHDRVHHQIYSLSKPKPFEIPLHPPGSDNPLLLDRPGIIALGCNIHDWMAAYIVVLETPFFQKTPAAGLARLADLPAGRYRLDVWHPRLSGNPSRELVIAPADTAAQTISVTLKEDKRRRRAPDGTGGGYK